MADGLLFGVPRRYVFIGVDLFLLCSIIFYAMMPSGNSVGPMAGYTTPDGRWVRETVVPANKAGADPTPWQNPAARRRKKRHPKKRKYQMVEEGESAGNSTSTAGESGKEHRHSRGKKRKRPRGKGKETSVNASAAAADACAAPPPSSPCSEARGRALVTLSISGSKKREHFAIGRLTMEAYAQRVGASFHVVDSYDHPALAKWNATLRAGDNSHFMKLPMMQYYVEHYSRVLFVDDDILLSPFAPDLFATVPCHKVGATVEAVHSQGWHAMHGRALCDIYRLSEELPATCGKENVKSIRIFNSGVMMLSEAHRPLFEGWDKQKLECRILCDQLYLNAQLHRHRVCLDDLGTAFNMPGTTIRKLLTSTLKQRVAAAAETSPPDLSNSPISDACIAHLTVLPAKAQSAHYLLHRALSHRDVLQCAHGHVDVNREAMLAKLPSLEYDIGHYWCKGRQDCQMIEPAANAAAGTPPPADEPSAAAPSPPRDAQLCAAHAAAATRPVGADEAAAAAALPHNSTERELPPAARRILSRAASLAWDCSTVILLFGTSDFMDLAFNWAQASSRIGVDNYVLVAMDSKLGDILERFDGPPGLLLPRVAMGDVVISKLNVIGERQRFGLRVLEAGFNVLFADLDAIFLRSPAPILADGDFIGERIWGRPMSVVKKWGAAICTGFYFVRSNPRTIKIFRRTHFMIATKRQRMPKWQASDQWAINHAIDDHVVDWEPGSRQKMKGIDSFQSKFFDNSSHVGFTRTHRSKFVVLPHRYVARSCPILKYGAQEPPKTDRGETKKWKIWQHLLKTAYALHCFPPHSMPCPGLKHGEKGCDKSVIMGSKVHIHGEVVFDQQQGLWFMADGWEKSIEAPITKDFRAWLKSQYNGLRAGQGLALIQRSG